MKKRYLIVVDMQNDFVTGSLGTKEAQDIVPNVIDKVNEYWSELHDEIIFTMDTHNGNDYYATLEGTKIPERHCLKYTGGWGIIDQLNEYIYHVVQKSTFGYLWEDEISSDDQITSIELCGLCTDVCVISNALILRTMFPNTKIIVDSSCCAGTTPEKHKYALEVIKSCGIDVI